MRKINILSKNVYNRIAAGEVVDRPYSVVKELLENSIDAKATEIEIYIEKGGKQLVKIVDNGGGIERDDMRAAFLPHATSKISKADDLDAIMTLGFRGEALASISSVAKVELVSKTEENPAYKCTCEGGIFGEIKPAAHENGTEITVCDLFFNTPVRQKFLKADKGEETDITNFVTRYILGYPEISFKYFADGKLKLQSFGGGLDEAVAQVYGAKTLSECFKLQAEKYDIKIRGFVGNQNFFKPNKTYQSLFLNGRYIVNNTIATAMSNAYSAYAMKRQYPFYVLFVDMPQEFVDVNVHPNKADVRFSDSRKIFGAVYSTVSSLLDGKAAAADFVVGKLPEIKSAKEGVENSSFYSDKKTEEEKDDLIEKYKPYKPEFKPASANEEVRGNVPEKPNVKITINSQQIYDEQLSGGRKYHSVLPDVPISAYFDAPKKSVMKITDEYLPPDPYNDAAYSVSTDIFAARQQKIDFYNYVYKGNLFNTYLIYEYKETVYLIDQHAAHERLLYDKLCESMSKRRVIKQPLLIPYYFEVNAQEYEFLECALSYLNEIGFGISPYNSKTFTIDSVPGDLSTLDVKEFIDDILSHAEEFKPVTLAEVYKDKLATCACKHAVKGGMQLTDMEVDELFEKINKNFGLKCPHGRPVCVRLTKSAIEKMFKRIV